MRSVGIVACSNPLGEEQRAENEKLFAYLQKQGCRVLVSDWIYEAPGSFLDGGKTRAEALMRLFENPEVTDIFDISGGDMANEVLDWLDYEKIAKSSAAFWGYSDLTTVLNAIYAKTGKSGVLYQIKYLPGREKGLFSPSFAMAQGDSLRGTVVGGNIRCFLKLAGTPYFPDLTGKILLLEARSGRVPQMITYLSQLRSCGVFQKISGILLGTFTQMEAEGCAPDMAALVKYFVPPELPIAKTDQIGHAPDARAIRIGSWLEIGKR